MRHMGQSLGCPLYPIWDQKDRMDTKLYWWDKWDSPKDVHTILYGTKRIDWMDNGTHETVLRMSMLSYMGPKGLI